MSNILEKAMEKVKTFFSGVVTPEEIEAIKSWVKLAETPVTPDVPKKPLEVKTKDGKIFSIEGELKAESVIKEATPEGLVDVADGEYELEDGTKIKVVGGKISEVAAKATDNTNTVPAEMAKVIAQLSEQKNAIEVKFEAQTKEIDELKKQLVVLSKHMTKILETPINTVTKTKVDIENMSAFERRNYYKSLQNG
jgi:hypothetical protein